MRYRRLSRGIGRRSLYLERTDRGHEGIRCDEKRCGGVNRVQEQIGRATGESGGAESVGDVIGAVQIYGESRASIILVGESGNSVAGCFELGDLVNFRPDST